MGLVLDSTVLIGSERRKETVSQIIRRMQFIYGNAEVALSTISIVELTHGVYRARDDAERRRREIFRDELCRDMIVHPVSIEIAQLAGRIEGEQAAKGIGIPFTDLIIGATALYLGFDVATLNLRHFQLIPELYVISF